MHICAIDIHHHYFPPGVLKEAKGHSHTLGVEVGETKEGRSTLSIGGGGRFIIPPDLLGVERRLSMMDKGMIAMATLEPHTACLGYRLDAQRGEAWCNLFNEGFKELIRQYPARFVALAAVPMQDPARAARVLEHAIRDLQLSGGYIGTNVNGQYYDSSDFDPFWSKAEELDALVVMHPENIAGFERMGPYGLHLICGNPADTTLSLGFLTYSGVFDRFPNLKLCVLHGGGFFPYHLGRFDQGYGVRPGAYDAKASSKPSAYLKNLYFDTLVYRVDILDCLKRLAGSSHLMIGTDYPYPLGDWMAVEKVQALEIPEAEKLEILEGNARRLLKL
ncbi:MAG: amidohydrolase family protein [Candidatus Binatia bacterium]